MHGHLCLRLCNYLIYWYIVNFKQVWDKMSQSWGGLLGRDVIYLMPIDNLENWGGVEYDKIESVGLYGNTFADISWM